MRQTIDLNGAWSMRPVGDEEWIPAKVPGSVASDLLRAGRIEDPYYRDRQYEVFDIFLKDYEYEREFELEAAQLEAARLELVCEGLDTIAELRLNGKELAHTWNMHRTYRLDLKGLAVAGRNKLQVTFRSPVNYVVNMQKERYLWAANDDYVVQGYPHLRKAHHMFGWDWGPKVPDSGIWRNIYIEAHQVGRIEDVYVVQKHAEDGTVTLDVRVQTERFTGTELQLDAVLLAPDSTVAASSELTVGETPDRILLSVSEPELWWPNGLGKQPLYELKLQLISEGAAVHEQSYKLGLRTLTVRQEPDAWGESFEFEVNGISIFTMGANYIPEDNIHERLSRKRTEQLIRDCVKANFNCIRVWGGGFYPDDDFFELCDQYGLIVWQDHLFACAEYEMTEAFTAEIKAEVADNVRRIRHHACLGLWCGNNEMEWAWMSWGFPKREKLRTDYIKQFEILIPEVTKAHDPETFYWKASPSSGGGFDDPNASDRGDVHYWEVWHGGKPFTEYRKHYFRFCSEFGFQSFPSHKTVAAFTEPGDRNIFTPVMESHQKNAGGNGKILFGISENFLYPKDFSSLLFVSQLLQAEAMRYGVEHWRRNRGRCMGSVYWQLNDCWPVASWSSIDYYGRWKALHYAAKRFYAPLLLSAEETGAQVKLVVTNDTLNEEAGTVVWKLREAGGRIVEEGSLNVLSGAMSAQPVADLDFSESVQGREDELYLEYALHQGGQEVSEGWVLFVRPKHFRLSPEPKLICDIEEAEDRFILTLHAESLALFVELDFAQLDARLSDNFFHVSAGRPKRIELMKSDLSSPASADQLRRELLLRSLADSYVC
ncbi:beta-mannosidase [Paenibacillus silviterrae]|uniref:beta-mannosidase n=1 Tax=Paenibacillus silviterrae TaxID=3242194 RepID=UPI002543C446|nr:glycoside hydrolase family 2 protein [Paenibacillus chinjuensis]